MTPATDWKEIVDGDELARFSRYAEQLVALRARRERGEPQQRALHTKMNLGVVAEFTVSSGLPEHARIGLFGTPAVYRAYVRFSNGMGQVNADRVPDVRGMAIKLVGVPGRKLIPGMEDAKTQDFLLIKTASTPFRNADEFVTFAIAAENRALMLPRLIAALGLRRTLGILRGALPIVRDRTLSLATTQFYSAAPIQYGPYAVRLSLRPHASDAPGSERGNARDYLAQELASRLKAAPVGYDFCVQFYRDPHSTPIEDHSVEWRQDVAPLLKVATLVLAKQDVDDEPGRRTAQYIDTLSFDPWHAQDVLRPLGNVMRARNHAYRASTLRRKAAAEPDGTEETFRK